MEYIICLFVLPTSSLVCKQISNHHNNCIFTIIFRLPQLAITVNEDYDQAVIPACIGWSDLDSSIRVPSTTHLVAGWGRTNNDR